jgi:O-antigen/teichoic acid export membrane protein
MDKANYIMSLSRLVTLIISFSLLYNGLGIESMLIANAVGYLYLHVASVRNINRLSPIRLFRLANCNKDAAVRIMSFGGGVTGITLLNMFISPFNKIILSRYVSIEAVVVYEIGYRISNQLKSVYHTFFKALLPEVSKESAKKTKEANLRVRNINNRSFRLILITGLPSYLILFIVAEPLMRIWLGNGYIESMPNVLRIFLVSSFFILLAIPSYFALLGIGGVNRIINAAIIQSFISVFGILSFILADISLTIYIVVFITTVGLILGSTYLMFQGRKQHLNLSY